jgi:hypothetical protein
VQHDQTSKPIHSLLPGVYDLPRENAASWLVELRNERLVYQCGFSEVQWDRKKKLNYHYIVRDWPFLLFEILHEAIGIEFDRTMIDLWVQVVKRDRSQGLIWRWPFVKHSQIKDLVTNKLPDS